MAYDMLEHRIQVKNSSLINKIKQLFEKTVIRSSDEEVDTLSKTLISAAKALNCYCPPNGNVIALLNSSKSSNKNILDAWETFTTRLKKGCYSLFDRVFPVEYIKTDGMVKSICSKLATFDIWDRSQDVPRHLMKMIENLKLVNPTDFKSASLVLTSKSKALFSQSFWERAILVLENANDNLLYEIKVAKQPIGNDPREFAAQQKQNLCYFLDKDEEINSNPGTKEKIVEAIGVLADTEDSNFLLEKGIEQKLFNLISKMTRTLANAQFSRNILTNLHIELEANFDTKAKKYTSIYLFIKINEDGNLYNVVHYDFITDKWMKYTHSQSGGMYRPAVSEPIIKQLMPILGKGLAGLDSDYQERLAKEKIFTARVQETVDSFGNRFVENTCKTLYNIFENKKFNDANSARKVLLLYRKIYKMTYGISKIIYKASFGENKYSIENNTNQIQILQAIGSKQNVMEWHKYKVKKIWSIAEDYFSSSAEIDVYIETYVGGASSDPYGRVNKFHIPRFATTEEGGYYYHHYFSPTGYFMPKVFESKAVNEELLLLQLQIYNLFKGKNNAEREAVSWHICKELGILDSFYQSYKTDDIIRFKMPSDVLENLRKFHV